MEDLHRKAALVTGAARGIGRHIALALAAAGADVAFTYRESESAARETVAEIEQARVRALAVHCDVRSPESVRKAVGEASREFGRLDVLVNNAGVFETARLEEITLEQWDRMFQTNTRGPFLMAQAAHPYLRATRGRIVNIGSLGGMHPWATHAHYSTSKAALHMLTRTMAKAFAPEISVNCVAPGMVVRGEAGSETDSDYEHFAHKTPMQRNGRPQEVAEAVMFFVRGPHFITGQILAVDGGLAL